MADCVVGAETVQRAGHSMVAAADSMTRAASAIDESLRRHERFLDDWLARLEAVMQRTGVSRGAAGSEDRDA